MTAAQKLFLLVLVVFLAMTGSAVADGRTEDAPLPLPNPPAQCASLPPVNTVQVQVNGETWFCPSPQAAACTEGWLDVLEADAPMRDKYWRGAIQAKTTSQLALDEIHQREMAEASAAYEDALDDAEGAATFWRWTAVAGTVVSLGVGAAASYYLTR